VADRVGAMDQHTDPFLILQRESLAALPAEPEMLERMRIVDFVRRSILVETKKASLAVIKRHRAIRIGAFRKHDTSSRTELAERHHFRFNMDGWRFLECLFSFPLQLVDRRL
jgi:hypothetical protein